MKKNIPSAPKLLVKNYVRFDQIIVENINM
jgi:hypothetical protein